MKILVTGAHGFVGTRLMKELEGAIADLVSDEELNEDFIMPEPFDPRVSDVVSQAVKSHIEAQDI